MQRIDHPLQSPSLGSSRALTSLHFGTPGARPKVYIQAGLHAEELPGTLVAHHLQSLLAQAEAGLVGEIILVPLANPIGLAQRLDHKPMGRFEFDTAENFNRHYPDLFKAVLPVVSPRLGPDAATNVALVRDAVAEHLQRWRAATELQSLRHRLISLAYDADVVLDLHCDCEAVLHLYAEEACWSALEPLARRLGCQAVLLARNSGGLPFDECLSGLWWQLAQAVAASGAAHPIPQACASTTVELRGEADVSHASARADALAIHGYLQQLGVAPGTAPRLPELACTPTPLAGSQTVTSRNAGVVVFAARPGERLRQGDMVAEVIDPVSQHVSAVRAEVDGVLYARIRERYVHAGGELAKIAGAVAYRSGDLLGA